MAGRADAKALDQRLRSVLANERLTRHNTLDKSLTELIFDRYEEAIGCSSSGTLDSTQTPRLSSTREFERASAVEDTKYPRTLISSTTSNLEQTVRLCHFTKADTTALLIIDGEKPLEYTEWRSSAWRMPGSRSNLETNGDSPQEIVDLSTTDSARIRDSTVWIALWLKLDNSAIPIEDASDKLENASDQTGEASTFERP